MAGSIEWMVPELESHTDDVTLSVRDKEGIRTILGPEKVITGMSPCFFLQARSRAFKNQAATS
jgi:hypothetical protein